MSYNLTTSDGSNLIILPTSTINTTATSIALIGQNSVNFGLYVNENFIYLMQNFANNTAPINPLIGQLWYDTVNATLKYYNGVVWKILTPPFTGMAGTATASIPPGIAVAFTLAGNQIVFATSLTAITAASLPTSVLINDTNYALASRFPNGISAGVTMAIDVNGLQFVGTATTANAFASNMTISVTNSAVGSVSFNGSGNVILPLDLADVVTPGTYTKVTVGSNGIVTTGNVINSTDVITALGYTPGQTNGAANSLIFGSNIILDGVIGGSNIFYGNSNITITTTFLDNPMPTNGIIAIPTSAIIPTGWYIANGQSVTLPNGGGTVVTVNLTSANLTGCYWIQKVY
jgi:hypothetical protein